jgi:hypothetical protein
VKQDRPRDRERFVICVCCHESESPLGEWSVAVRAEIQVAELV